MHELLEKLYRQQNLDIDEAKSLFQTMMQGKLDPILIAASLISLRVKGEYYTEIAGAAHALLADAQAFPTPDYSFGDIVGTGGDNSNTLNISTLSAFVATSLGLKMAKHGNRSVSSKCGSFDFLEELGIPFQLTPTQLRKQMDETGICFLFAPLFHRGIKHVMPIRKTLKTKTIFNILGPLINPARPKFQMVGVYTPELLLPIAKVLIELKLQRGFVVHGHGLDEIAPHGETNIIEIRDGKMKSMTIQPTTFGFKEFSLASIQGGEKAENCEKSLRILSGLGSHEEKQMLAMNIAPLLLMDDKVADLKQGAEMAMEHLKTDHPYQLTQRIAHHE